MDKYHVVFSDSFTKQLAVIEADFVDYGKAHTLKYVSEVVGLCAGLDIFPHRYQARTINDQIYRLFGNKAHTIFYQVSEDQLEVAITAILPSRSDFKRWL
ncbi:MAG: hypothetical protein COB20_07100 [SAR86 cluster bacterium]|uniref:Plasmid stabilization protein n=1 Tax=SAR86 cluster bacterium TaxID=2030880 RepID=A0A2A4X700_9GAMM|nr:MAG: hypothetical protein COB20_07100 [SAR86 cluster bacterium]